MTESNLHQSAPNHQVFHRGYPIGHPEFDLEDSVKDVKMPPLILQPLIENALIHGFKSQMRDGRIVVRAKMTEDQVELSVEDNGDGMDSAVLEELNSKRFSQSVRREGHTTGLGLGNVYER